MYFPLCFTLIGKSISDLDLSRNNREMTWKMIRLTAELDMALDALARYIEEQEEKKEKES